MTDKPTDNPPGKSEAEDQKPTEPRHKAPLPFRLVTIWGIVGAATLAYANHQGADFAEVLFGSGTSGTPGPRGPSARGPGGFGNHTFIHFHK